LGSLASSPEELELIHSIFETLLASSARATKIRTNVLVDVLSLLNDGSDSLGDDWVLDLLTRNLKQQPAPKPEALTSHEDAEMAITEICEAIGRTRSVDSLVSDRAGRTLH
jgi:hypothetical protein